MRKISLASIAVAALVLSACGGDDPETPETPAPETTASVPADEPTADETEDIGTDETEEPTDVETDDTEEPPTGDGEFSPAPWAAPINEVGDHLGTVTAGDLEFQVYQVGTDVASKDSILVDAETEEPLVKEGDDVVILNYIVTNTGSEAHNLTISLADVGVEYEDWPYLGGQATVTDNDMLESYGVSSRPFGESGTEDVYTLGAGESYNYAEIIEYRPDVQLVADIEWQPRDDEGERIDERYEGEELISLN